MLADKLRVEGDVETITIKHNSEAVSSGNTEKAMSKNSE